MSVRLFGSNFPSQRRDEEYYALVGKYFAFELQEIRVFQRSRMQVIGVNKSIQTVVISLPTFFNYLGFNTNPPYNNHNPPTPPPVAGLPPLVFGEFKSVHYIPDIPRPIPRGHYSTRSCRTYQATFILVSVDLNMGGLEISCRISLNLGDIGLLEKRILLFDTIDLSS